MKTIYRPTALETWVAKCFKQMGLYLPSDLDEERICRSLGVFYKEMEKYSHSIEIGRFKLIVVNSTLEREVQREQFYHELGTYLKILSGYHHAKSF